MAKIHFSILLVAIFAVFLMAPSAGASHFSLTYGLTDQWIDILSANSSAIKAGYEIAVIVRGNITIGTSTAAVGDGWYFMEAFGNDTETDGAHMNDTLEFRVWNGTAEFTPISSPPSINWTYPVGGDSPLATLFVDLYELPTPYIAIDSPHAGIIYNSSSGFELNYTTNLNLSEAYYTIDGVNHSFNDWFYQENASARSCNGSWTWGEDRLFDADWSTYARSPEGNCYVNYTLHVQNVSEIKWMSKIGYSDVGFCFGTYNISIPSECISSPLQLRFRSTYHHPAFDLDGTEWDCWNSSVWVQVFSCSLGALEDNNIYEEALWERNMSPRSREWLYLGNGSHTIQVCGISGGITVCDSVNILVGSIAVGIDSPFEGVVYNSTAAFELNYTTNVNLTDAVYSVDGGANHSFAGWSYQENASAWNCSGSWYNESGWGATAAGMFDGDWENYAGSENGRCLVNYTFRAQSVSEVNWTFRVGSSGEEECWGVGNHNASIPSACMSTPLQLRFLSARLGGDPPRLMGQLWDCWNGTAWDELFECSSHPEAELVWEEAIWENDTSPRSSEMLTLENGTHTIQVCGSAGGITACDSVNMTVGYVSPPAPPAPAVVIVSPYEGIIYNYSSAIELYYTANVNLTDAAYSIDGGANHSLIGWSYQENSSVWSCSGTWYCFASECSPPSALFDGGWSNIYVSSGEGTCSLNYTLRVQNVSEIVWQNKIGMSDSGGCWGVHNTSMPSGCISSPLQLKFRSTLHHPVTDTEGTLWDCWNGTGWAPVYNCSLSSDDNIIWEEAIWENDTSPRSRELLYLENGTHTVQVCGISDGITVCDSANIMVGSLAVEIGSPYVGFIYNNLTGFVLNYTSNVNLTGAIYSIDGGANHSFAGWSYQENPSVWSCDENWFHPDLNMFDENWNTYASGVDDGKCYLNYSLRAWSVSEVKWQSKFGNDAYGCGGTYNNTIPSECISPVLQLRFNSSGSPPADIMGTQWDCWNGTSWVWVFGCSMLSPQDNYVWEEAIWENDTSPRSSEWLYLGNGTHTIQVCGSAGGVTACDSVNVTVVFAEGEEVLPPEGGETNIYGMLADSGSGLGGFLTAVNEPLVNIALALGVIGGILTVIFGIVAAIASAFGGIGELEK